MSSPLVFSPPPRGRATGWQIASRFDRQRRDGPEAGEGWGTPADWGVAEAGPATELAQERARRILSYNQSPDLGFDRSINPYRGCEHGCIYCYARPTHGYLGLSPGLDFETRLVAKVNAAECLRTELARPTYRPAPVAIGTVTDAYQPVERRLGLTRAVLQVLADCRHPCQVITKSSGVERDLDLLAPMAAQGLAGVHISLTTLDERLAQRLEPRAVAPWRRLQTIERLSRAGVPVGVSLSPMIPFLNEPELERLVAAAAGAGAQQAFFIPLRLPWEVAPLFEAWLQAEWPDRAARVLARLRDLRGGRLNDPRHGSRMTGQGAWADLLRQRFALACRRHGLQPARLPLDSSRFRPPGPAAAPAQAALF